MTSTKHQKESSTARARHRLILDAAQALIVSRGLEGFRIREVAHRAGMHHASLLHYFPHRESLIRGVVERIVAQLDRVPAPGTAEHALSPQHALHAHFSHILAQLRDYPERFIVLNEVFLRAARDVDVHTVLAPIDVRWHDYLIHLLTVGREQGVFRRDLHPEVAALAITNFFKGLTLQLDVPFERIAQSVDQLERWILSDEEKI